MECIPAEHFAECKVAKKVFLSKIAFGIMLNLILKSNYAEWDCVWFGKV